MHKFAFFEEFSSSDKFQNWKQQNPHAYLTHFFRPLDSSLKLTSHWEVGFYTQETDKITTFVLDEDIQIKPEEEAFKKEGTVEKLDLDKINVDHQQALEIFKQTKEKEYPQEIILSGFLILQHHQENIIWNISFATRSMNILNIKINAEDANLLSHQLINFIQQQAG